MIARAVAAAAPLMLGWAALVVVLAGRWERNLPPAAAAPAPPLRVSARPVALAALRGGSRGERRPAGRAAGQPGVAGGAGGDAAGLVGGGASTLI